MPGGAGGGGTGPRVVRKIKADTGAMSKGATGGARRPGETQAGPGGPRPKPPKRPKAPTGPIDVKKVVQQGRDMGQGLVDRHNLKSPDPKVRQRARANTVERAQRNDTTVKVKGPLRTTDHAPDGKGGYTKKVEHVFDGPHAQAELEAHKARQELAAEARAQLRASTIRSESDIKATVRDKAARQRRVDERTIKTDGMADPSKGPLSRRKELRDQSQDSPAAMLQKKAETHREHQVQATKDPKTSKFKRAARVASEISDPNTADQVTRAVLKRNQDLTHQEAMRIKGADAEAKQVAQVDKAREGWKNVPGNALREAKDMASNPVPVAQSLITAGKEVVGAGVDAAASKGKRRRKTPTADALKKGLLDDPVVHLVKGDVKGAIHSAQRNPLSAAGELVSGVGAVGKLSDLAKGEAAVKAARARPRLSVLDGHVSPGRGRKGVRAVRAARKAAAAAPDAPARTYSRKPAVRAAQKTVENVKAAAGKDPMVARGRKAKRIVRKQVITETSKAHSIGRKVEDHIATGEMADIVSGEHHTSHNRIRDSKVAQRHESKQGHNERDRVLAQELYAHVHDTRDVQHRIDTLEHELKTGAIANTARHHAEQTGADSAAAGKAATAAEQRAQKTIGYLRDYRDAVGRVIDRSVAHEKKVARETAHVRNADLSHPLGTEPLGAPHTVHGDLVVKDTPIVDGPPLDPRDRLPDHLSGHGGGDTWALDLHQAVQRQREVGRGLEADRQRQLGYDAQQMRTRSLQAWGVATGRLKHVSEGEHYVNQAGQKVKAEQDLWLRRAGDRDAPERRWKPTGQQEILDRYKKVDVGYLPYGNRKAPKSNAIGERSNRQGFTGHEVHTADLTADTLGGKLGGLQRDLNEAATMRPLLKRATGSQNGKGLSLEDAQALAAHLSDGGVKHVVVPLGKTRQPLERRSGLPDHVPDPEGDAGPHVVMPAPVHRLWQQQQKTEGRALAAGQMINRQFFRSVLALNPLWQLGNSADLASRLALSGWRSGDKKLGQDLAYGLHAEGVDHHAVQGLFDTVLGHVGARRSIDKRDIRDVVRSKNASGHGRADRIGESLHRAFSPVTKNAAARGLNALVDKGFNLSTRSENKLIAHAQGTAARQLARDLGIAQRDMAALAKAMHKQPALQEKFYELTLGIVGDYVRHAPNDGRWAKVAMPFLDWVRVANKFVWVTLPANHPVKVALYLEAARATEEQRRQLGMSDYITAKEARALKVPAPVDGFLNGGASWGPLVFPTGYLTSAGEAAAWLKDPTGQLGGHTLPQINKIVSALLGHSGAETTQQLRRVERQLGVSTSLAQADKGGDADVSGKRVGQAALQFGKNFVPGFSRGAKQLGLNQGPAQGGVIGASQGGQGNAHSGDVISKLIGAPPQRPPGEKRKLTDQAHPGNLIQVGDGIVGNLATGDESAGSVFGNQKAAEERKNPKARAKARVDAAVKSIGHKPTTYADARAQALPNPAAPASDVRGVLADKQKELAGYQAQLAGKKPIAKGLTKADVQENVRELTQEIAAVKKANAKALTVRKNRRVVRKGG